jgi:hypothetical protein
MTVTELVLLEDGFESLLESGEQGPARDIVWTVRLAALKWSCDVTTKWRTDVATKWEAT